MKRADYETELKKLYAIAVKKEDVLAAIEMLDRMQNISDAQVAFNEIGNVK